MTWALCVCVCVFVCVEGVEKKLFKQQLHTTRKTDYPDLQNRVSGRHNNYAFH